MAALKTHTIILENLTEQGQKSESDAVSGDALLNDYVLGIDRILYSENFADVTSNLQPAREGMMQKIYGHSLLNASVVVDIFYWSGAKLPTVTDFHIHGVDENASDISDLLETKLKLKYASGFKVTRFPGQIKR